MREREREFKDFNRLEKEGMRVYEKELGSRPNRKGVIRSIKSIKPSSTTALGTMNMYKNNFVDGDGTY